jgi:high-affinity Fe2+/Pb2+ permease
MTKKNLGILLLFISMGLFYWGYHESQQIAEPVAGLLQKDNGTRHILYINAAAVAVLLVGGYLSMDEYS